MAKSKPCYDDWVQAVKDAPTISDRILAFVRDRSREAFDASDPQVAPTTQDIREHIGGTDKRVYNHLERLKRARLLVSVQDEESGRIWRWLAADGTHVERD